MCNIFDILEKNKFFYKSIREKSYVSLLDNKEYDVNVIIGFRGRKEFLTPLIESLQDAFLYYKKINPSTTFCLTFVEHSEKSECKHDLVDITNYLWTPGNVVEQYSRSFAYNFGVKYSNKAKYYLLHDLDILVKKNFFEELFQNLNNSKCIQPYGKRRVLYLSQELTRKVIDKEVDYNNLNEDSKDVFPPMFNGKPHLGSKGGSVFIERDLFFEIGGLDPELFWGYAAEDQMLWDKIITIIGEVDYADNPPIDMFHMWHPPTFMSNPLVYEMENYMMQFRNMKKKDRVKFLEIKKELFNEF